MAKVMVVDDDPDADQFPTDEYVPIAAWITKPTQPDHLLKTVKRLVG